MGPALTENKILYTVSIAAHNRLDLTLRCLESLRSAAHDPSRVEVILFDNGSSDGTKERVEAMQVPYSVRVVRSEENLGFGEAHNRVARMANGKWLVILNNDATASLHGWLDTMRSEFGKVERLAACGVRGTCCALTECGDGVPSLEAPEYVEGSCMMIPRDLALEFGPFDVEAFPFAYFEDSDLSLRLRRAGWRISNVEVGFAHEVAATAKLVAKTIDIPAIIEKNRAMFCARWADYLATRRIGTSTLIIRHGAGGDVLLLTPVIQALSEKYPASDITVETACPEPLRGNPNVRAIAQPGKANRASFDRVYDLNLAYERKPWKHIVSAYAEECGVQVNRATPTLYPDRKDMRWAAETLDRKQRWVVVHPGPTGWLGRDILPDTLQDVCTLLRDDGWSIACVGNKAAHEIPCDVELRSRTSSGQLAALMRMAELFVGVDSMPMHYAVAAGIPVVGVFGAIDPSLRLPWDAPWAVGVVAKDVDCLGCHHRIPPPITFSRCPRKVVECMTKLSAEDIRNACRNAHKAWRLRGGSNG